MKFTILTLFPDMVEAVLGTSMLGRAAKAGAVNFDVQNLRQWGDGVHMSVDDAPYGGGAGMVLKVDVVDRALVDLITHHSSLITPKIILLTPQGQKFDQTLAESYAADQRDLVLIAGHYEGFDERIRSLVDEEVSIGDFVLTGGELPALMIVDAITRLLPGSLGSDESAKEESFSITAKIPLNPPLSKGEMPLFRKEPFLPDRQGSVEILNEQPVRLLEYPHYTRPATYRPVSRDVGELVVPPILTSGDHAKISAWRTEQALERTEARRPDLLG